MEITPAWDNSQRTYEHEGSYFVTPPVPNSEGELLICCTDQGQHPSRELGRGRWEEARTPESPGSPSLVHWSAPFVVHGRPRFVPLILMHEYGRDQEVRSKRGDPIFTPPTNYSFRRDVPYDSRRGENIFKQQFDCPSCHRRTVLGDVKLGMYVFMELISRDIGDGGRVRLDVSNLRSQLPPLVKRSTESGD